MNAKIFTALTGPYMLPSSGLILIAYLIISYFLVWYRLRNFNGPFLAAFSYVWMFRVSISGQQSRRYRDINARYGSNLVRIGPNELITSDPELIRRMGAARSSYGRSFWYSAIKTNPHDDNLFSITDTGKHDRLKAQLSFGYAGKENPSLEASIDEQIDGLVSLIRRKYLSAGALLQPMDFARVSKWFTLDVITQIAYGKEFGYLATDSDMHGYVEAVEAFVPPLVLLAEIPPIGKFVFSDLGLRLIVPKKTDKRGYGKLLALAERVVADRFIGTGADEKIKEPERQDMLASFLRHGLSKQQCENEVLLQILAGSDGLFPSETTSTAIRGTMLYLSTTRRAYDSLQKEIDKGIVEGRISSPVTYKEGKNLPYLQAVIYEGIRMKIPFSGLVIKKVPPEGDTYNGVFIPGGTGIAQNTLALQRSTAIFGDDVEVFRPERWLEASPAQRTQMVSTTELIFGYGRWACIGKPVAFMELHKVFVELFRRFDFQLVNPDNPWHETNYNVFFHSDMWVRITERDPKAVLHDCRT